MLTEGQRLCGHCFGTLFLAHSVTFLGCSTACMANEHGETIPPPVQDTTSVEAASQSDLTYFGGSAAACAQERRPQYCPDTDNAVTHCIKVRKNVPGELDCKIQAKGQFKRRAAEIYRYHFALREFRLNQEDGVQCFDFTTAESLHWRFLSFSGFHGQCQRPGEDGTQLPWECNPESSACSWFEIDWESCFFGWPCLKIYVLARSLNMSPCTTALQERGHCSPGDSNFFATVTIRNSGSAAIRCDMRMEAKLRTNNGVGAFVVKRSLLFPPSTESDVHFKFNESFDDVETVNNTFAVCRSAAFTEPLSSICDLDSGRCEEESAAVLAWCR